MMFMGPAVSGAPNRRMASARERAAALRQLSTSTRPSEATEPAMSRPAPPAAVRETTNCRAPQTPKASIERRGPIEDASSKSTEEQAGELC